MSVLKQWDLATRLRAAGVHLCISLLVAVAVAVWVFGVWYPAPYRELSGGRELFQILITVDVILGPCITFAVFNRRKPKRELGRDLTVVGLLQLLALAYGVWTVAVARPVHLVFEFDRFRVVHAIEVPAELLDRTPSDVRALPLWGPTPLAVRPFKDEQEKSEATLAALQGLTLAARPDLWQPYAQATQRVLAQARPAAQLKSRFPNDTALIDATLTRTGRSPDQLVYLPVVGRKSFWTAVLDARTADVLAFLPLDSF